MELCDAPEAPGHSGMLWDVQGCSEPLGWSRRLGEAKSVVRYYKQH